MIMRSQILDKQRNVISEKEVKSVATARVTYARAKYFVHTAALPKSEIISVPSLFND